MYVHFFVYIVLFITVQLLCMHALYIDMAIEYEIWLNIIESTSQFGYKYFLVWGTPGIHSTKASTVFTPIERKPKNNYKSALAHN